MTKQGEQPPEQSDLKRDDDDVKVCGRLCGQRTEQRDGVAAVVRERRVSLGEDGV